MIIPDLRDSRHGSKFHWVSENKGEKIKKTKQNTGQLKNADLFTYGGKLLK